MQALSDLNAEFKLLEEDRQFLREKVLPLFSDDRVFLPVNLKRLIWNTQKIFGINQRKHNDMDPIEVIRLVRGLYDK